MGAVPPRRLALSNRRLVRSFVLAALLLAPSARAELAAWDQGKVTGLAKDLVKATDALHEAFIQQSPPANPGSTQSEAYYRLRFSVWMIHSEASILLTSLENGDAREPTQWVYDNLMSHTRSARSEAQRASVAKEVGERAGAVRGVLNRLGPYYDPDFQTIAPDPNIERGATP